MKTHGISPDPFLLALAARTLKVFHGLTGASPLLLQVYPAPILICVSAGVWMHAAIVNSPYWLAMSAACLGWALSHWHSMRGLHRESTMRWSAELFRSVSARAEIMTEKGREIRPSLILVAVVMTVMVAADPGGELAFLGNLRLVSLAGPWGIIGFVYLISARPPEPDEGDPFLRPFTA